jgi:hypothetical protein
MQCRVLTGGGGAALLPFRTRSFPWSLYLGRLLRIASSRPAAAPDLQCSYCGSGNQRCRSRPAFCLAAGATVTADRWWLAVRPRGSWLAGCRPHAP